MEARRHHFVPQCWLAGFTESGTKDGKLYVTDFIRGKQWQTTPAGCGHVRDLYRVEGSDPLIVERLLSEIESATGPILKRMFEDRRGPRGIDEWGRMFEYMAIQFSRVPSFRPYVLQITNASFRNQLSKVSESREAWAEFKRGAGILEDTDEEKEYCAIRAFVEHPDDFQLSAGNDWHLLRAFEAAKGLVPGLAERFWETWKSPAGRFIGCDSPIILESGSGEIIGFKNADFVFFPSTRYAVLCGTRQRIEPPPGTYNKIAHHNTLTMMRSHEQVFSHTPEFCWMDSNGKTQTDWSLFSKDEKLMDLRKLGEREVEKCLESLGQDVLH